MGGATGIQFNSGASLDLSDATVTNFTGVGVNFAPSGSPASGLKIKNSTIQSNAGGNVLIKSQGGNLAGGGIVGSQIGGAAAAVTVDGTGGFAAAAISECNIGATSTNAITATQGGGGSAFVMVDRTLIFGAQNALVANTSGAEIDLNLSTIAGIVGTVASASNGVVVKSFGNNAISAYGSLGALTSIPLH